MAHHHFTRDDRVLLAKLKLSGLSVRSCARILGFHPSSIYRELKRGVANTACGYDVRIARKRTKQPRCAASRWLWTQSKAFIRSMWQFLRHKKLRRKYGKDNSGYLVTLVERKSGYALVGSIPHATKEAFRLKAEELLAPLPKHLKRSLTLDNGTEMNDYEELEQHLNMPIYFAHPYHSWERGSNENFNGLLRQFFPKGSDFSSIRNQQVDLAANLLNTRPRKRHGYRSPAELLKPYLDVAI